MLHLEMSCVVNKLCESEEDVVSPPKEMLVHPNLSAPPLCLTMASASSAVLGHPVKESFITQTLWLASHTVEQPVFFPLGNHASAVVPIGQDVVKREHGLGKIRPSKTMFVSDRIPPLMVKESTCDPSEDVLSENNCELELEVGSVVCRFVEATHDV